MTGSEAPTPGLPAALERHRPGGFHSFHPCAAQPLLQPGTCEGLGLWVARSCSAAAPGIWLTSPSALVMFLLSALLVS